MNEYSFVWRRELADDVEACGWTEPVSGNKMVIQLLDEVDLNPAYKGRVRASRAVLLVGDQYFVLCKVSTPLSWEEFIADFQPTFDAFSAAGRYELASATKWPTPPWID